MASNPISKSVTITLAAALITSISMPVSSAYAGKRHHRNHTAEIVGGGIIGLAFGAIIADSGHRRQHRADRIYEELPAYYPPGYVEDYQRPYYEEQGPIAERAYRNNNYYNQPAPLPRDDYGPAYKRSKKTYRKSSQPEPKVITYNEAMSNSNLAEPWSPQWYSYCRSTYRSFNAKSGTFLGYDGIRHFCVPK